jgi:hypothetical protein
MQIAAHHEAGHVVIAAVEGLRLRAEGIMLDATGEGGVLQLRLMRRPVTECTGLSLWNAQQCREYPGLSRQIVPGNSQNWPLRIMCAASIPWINLRPVAALRGPCMLSVRRLIDRWSDSIRLFA